MQVSRSEANSFNTNPAMHGSGVETQQASWTYNPECLWANGLRELCNVKDKGIPKQQSCNRWAGSESDTLQTVKKPQQQ